MDAAKTLDIHSVDLVIVTPTAWEYQEMVAQISNSTPVDSSPIPMVTGSIAGHSVLCCQSGKGQEETASSVTMTLERTRGELLLLVGIAGGFPEQGVHRGDVIVAHSVHSFDYGKLTSGVFKRRPELDFNCDRGLLSRAELVAADKRQSWRRHIRTNRPDRKDHAHSTAHVDCYVASSNKVIDDPDHKFFSAVSATFSEIHAVEMEAVGAGASARLVQSERKLRILMIRGISDEPGTVAAGGKSQRSKWKVYAAAAAAAFTRRLIENLPTGGDASRTGKLLEEGHAAPFQTGGTLPAGALCYVARECDDKFASPCKMASP